MVEVSRRIARTASGLGFALLTACGDAAVGTHKNPPYNDGGSVTHSDSTVTDHNGTITQDGGVRDGTPVDSGTVPRDGDGDGTIVPDGGARDGTPVDSGTTIPDGGSSSDGDSSSTAPDAGSDGPLNPTGSCAAVPVPMAGAGREVHVTTTGNDG